MLEDDVSVSGHTVVVLNETLVIVSVSTLSVRELNDVEHKPSRHSDEVDDWVEEVGVEVKLRLEGVDL